MSNRQLIQDALTHVRDRYIFPEKAAEVAAVIGARVEAGEYDDLDEAGLAARITEEFFALSADRHLRLMIRPPERHAALTEAEEVAAWHETLRLTNHRIAAVRRLDGNVGYLDLRGVTSPDVGGASIAAAMGLVAHTDALIIDLRQNRGGDPDGVQMWCSYLFPDSDTHLNSIYSADTKHTRDYWTLSYLPGSRYLDRPVYLLTSSTTFSAGEEFAYNLKAQGRATLIGEVTRGGAHPTARIAITPTLEVTVPNARSINPVTGTNWEGTGVVPDIATAAEAAFDHAYRLALEHVARTSTAPAVLAEAQAAQQSP